MTKVIDQYSLEQPLGTDPYGFQLFTARHIKNGELFTVQNVSSDKFSSPQFFQDAITNEITIHKKVCHGNIKNFVKMFKTAKNYYLVYEYCSGGTLYDKVTTSRLTESQQNNFIRQLVLGVRELHNSGIAHLNLSPHMIFLAAGGMIKIANFAHAREVAKGSSVECDIAKMQFTEMLAPEQTSKGTNGLYSDVYSLAKIIAFIKYGKIEEVETLVAEKAKTKDPLAELLQSMMQKEPSKRPDMDSVRQAINSAVTKKGSFSPSCAQPRDLAARNTSEEVSLTPPKLSKFLSDPTSIDTSASMNTSKANSLNVPKSRISKQEKDISDTKSIINEEGEEKILGSEAKRLCKERNKYYFLMMIASDVNQMNLCPNSPKLSFLIAKKAYVLAKKLGESLDKSVKKSRIPGWHEIQIMNKTIMQQVHDIEQFYKSLTESICKEKNLLADSAFELQTEQNESINEVYLRKQIKDYINTVFPRIDYNKREQEATTQKTLQHINNVSDVQILDKFFTNYMNDSVVHLLDQVYFGELEKMEIKDLHRFVSQKIS